MKKFSHAIKILLATKEKLFWDNFKKRWLVSDKNMDAYIGITHIKIKYNEYI
jgi:hypothetical protein